MTLSSLLLCQDQHLRRVFNLVLKDLEVEVELCEDAYTAKQLLAQRRFDAVLVECDHRQENLDFLSSLKKSPYNKRAILLSIVKEPTQVRSLRDLGVHFVIEEPVSVARVTPTLRAARNLMNRERRRSFRKSVQMPVNFRRDGNTEFDGIILDLSRDGIAIKSHELFQKAHRTHLSFCLPGTDQTIEVEGEVVWKDEYGRAGIHFTGLRPESETKLEKWLWDRRRFSRKSVIEVTARLTNPHVKELEARVLDLSEGGMAIKCSEQLQPGSTFQVQISSSASKERPEAVGKVVWAAARLAGITFVNMSPRSQEILGDWTAHKNLASLYS